MTHVADEAHKWTTVTASPAFATEQSATWVVPAPGSRAPGGSGCRDRESARRNGPAGLKVRNAGRGVTHVADEAHKSTSVTADPAFAT